MKKQSVCVIGGGLTGLLTAISLSKFNLKVDLIAKNFNENYKSLRTTALSDSNCKFLNEQKILNYNMKNLWPCCEIKLYDSINNDENEKILNLSKKSFEENILYIISNNKIVQTMKQKIKKDKKINILSNIDVKKIFLNKGLKFLKTNHKKFLKYNLVIICTGSSSAITKNFLGNKYSQHSYNEVSAVTVIKHKFVKNNIARQYFLAEGPLALLPISNTQTSIVWSIKKNFLSKIKINNDLSLKKKLNNIIKKVYSNIEFMPKFEYNNLNFHISHKYFNNRELILGDALHSIHPIVGQGFNMIIRDIIKLEEVIKKQINLGLDVGDTLALSKFTDNTKPNNFIYSAGTEIIKKLFSNNNIPFKVIRNSFLRSINDNQKVKNFFIKVADEGISL